MDEKPEPKISLPEALVSGAFLFALPDTIEIILLFFGLDDFWLTDAFAFPGSQIYLRLKGVRSEAALVGNVLELIPYVGALPLRTLSFIGVLYMDRHPKIAALTEVAMPKKPVARGGPADALSKPVGDGPAGPSAVSNNSPAGRVENRPVRTQPSVTPMAPAPTFAAPAAPHYSAQSDLRGKNHATNAAAGLAGSAESAEKNIPAAAQPKNSGIAGQDWRALADEYARRRLRSGTAGPELKDDGQTVDLSQIDEAA